MANFSKSDLVKEVSSKTGLTKAHAEEAIAAIFGTIKAQVEAGQVVLIQGFGRFKIKESAARQGRNPRTGETVQIDAKRAIKFSPSKSST